jgi:nitric oxide reductase NorD protein
LPSETGPSLSFEWEIALFRGLRALGRRLLAGSPADRRSAEAIDLAPRAERLAVLAQVVAGIPLRVLPSQGTAGAVGFTLFLPPVIDGWGTAQDHEHIYLFRAVLLAEIIRQGLHRAPPSARPPQAAHEVTAVQTAMAALDPVFPRLRALAAPLAARLLAERRSVGLAPEEQIVEAQRRQALASLAGVEAPAVQGPPGQERSAPVLLWGEFLEDAQLSPKEREVAAEQARPPTAVTTEINAPNASQVRHVELDTRKIEESTLTHTFEKIETADAFLGGGRDLDGTDELEDHGEALSEVPLSAVTRSDEDVHAILRADVGSFAEIPDVASVQPGERGIPYDEWDAARRAYRERYCTVYPGRYPPGDPAFAAGRLARHARVIEEARRLVEQALSRLEPRRRQLDGDRVDIDALVRHLAELKSGHALEGRLYARRTRSLPSLATTVLMDVSLSSDSWVEDRRVLDVERDAVLVLGEVMDRLGESLEILAFCSHTRNRCRVFDVRRRGEPWSLGKARLASLKPQGYTRIGPALRHATAELCRTTADRRLLLLFSDGKPTDYDRYEGRHGIEDVRQATREASQRGVHVHGLALAAHTRGTFPAMFGPNRYHLLPEVALLPRALAAVYARLRVSLPLTALSPLVEPRHHRPRPQLHHHPRRDLLRHRHLVARRPVQHRHAVRRPRQVRVAHPRRQLQHEDAHARAVRQHRVATPGEQPHLGLDRLPLPQHPAQRLPDRPGPRQVLLLFLEQRRLQGQRRQRVAGDDLRSPRPLRHRHHRGARRAPVDLRRTPPRGERGRRSGGRRRVRPHREGGRIRRRARPRPAERPRRQQRAVHRS